MKKTILAILLCSLICPVFAIEWGGLFNETGKLSFGKQTGELEEVASISVRQSNGISLWCTVPFKSDLSWYMTTQASYKYYYDFTLLGNNITHIADLDLLKLNGTIKTSNGSFLVAAGRYIVMDNSGKVFSQNCDGLTLKYTTPFVSTSVYAGYTGLLNANNVSILNDEALPDNGKETFMPFYTKVHGYVPLTLSVDFPSLFLNQAVSVQAEAFLDVEKVEDKDLFNRYYGTLSLSGPFGGPFYYSLVSVFGTTDFASLMNLSALSFQMYVDSISLKIGVEYASGAQGPFSPFIGFDSNPAYNSIYSPEYSGVLLPGIDFTFTKNQFCFMLNGKLVLGMPEDSITVKGINLNLKSYINIFSDMQLEVSGIGYYDLDTDNAESYYSANLGLLISF